MVARTHAAATTRPPFIAWSVIRTSSYERAGDPRDPSHLDQLAAGVGRSASRARLRATRHECHGPRPGQRYAGQTRTVRNGAPRGAAANGGLSRDLPVRWAAI